MTNNIYVDAKFGKVRNCIQTSTTCDHLHQAKRMMELWLSSKPPLSFKIRMTLYFEAKKKELDYDNWLTNFSKNNT